MDEKMKKSIKKKLPWYSYLILLLGIVIFSGILDGPNSPITALGFNNVLGEFGVMGKVDGNAAESGVSFARNFQGMGGFGVKDGFLLGLSVAPSMILAFALIEILTDFGGIEAAEKLLSVVTRPLLGLPGASALPVVANLTTVDSSAVLTRELYDAKTLTYKELIILNVFIFSAPSTVVNWYMFPGQLRSYIEKPFMLGLVVVLILKFVGVFICRLYLKLFYKDEEVMING